MNASELDSATGLAEAYEALRAQATGTSPAVTPRGLALFLRGGLAAWMAAWTRPAAPPPVALTQTDGPRPVLAGLSTELVGVLAEMVLAGRRRVLA